MIKLAHSGKEMLRAALLEAHDQTLLPRAFDVKALHDGTGALQGMAHDFLVDLERVLRDFGKEGLVGDFVDVRFIG